MTARCRGCDAPIIWCKTSAGKSIPVDIDPIPRGTVILLEAPKHDDQEVGCLVLRKDDVVSPTTKRYRSHFAVCPNARQFRKKKEPTP